jgi:schlafen family protein
VATLVEELIRGREGSAVDFKADASSPKGIVKCFVAFGNTAGGWIVVGVDDDRNVVGLENPQAVEQAISNAIYSSTDPPQRPRVSFATHEGEEVVLVDAQFFQGAEPLRLKEGDELTVYERVGSNAIPVTDVGRLEQISASFRTHISEPFDTQESTKGETFSTRLSGRASLFSRQSGKSSGSSLAIPALRRRYPAESVGISPTTTERYCERSFITQSVTPTTAQTVFISTFRSTGIAWWSTAPARCRWE